MDASLSQSLHLLNSKDIQSRISSETGRAALLAKDHQRDSAARIVELYRVAVGRDARPSEIQTAEQHLSRIAATVKDGKDAAETEKATTKARREAWEDVVWALLNTKEFLFNH